MQKRNALLIGASLGTALLAVVGSLTVFGTGVDGFQHAARYTARLSFAIFLVVFAASSLHRLLRTDLTRWLVKSRRGLGLAFGTAHLVHLGALIAFSTKTDHPPEASTIVAGGFAYVVLIAMMATSNDAAVRRLGRNWRRLHHFGVYTLAAVFALTYALLTAAGVDPVMGSLGVALLGVAWGLRIAASRRRTASATSAPAKAA